MPDLMKDTYEYSRLANQYGNFHLPSVKIFINGTDMITSMGVVLSDISVVLSLSTAGYARFKLGNIYDVKNRSFKSGVTDKFRPGTIVEIGLGYFSSVIKVFKGFVYLIGAEFGDQNLLVVTVMDVRKLMMVSGTRYLLHDVKNYSDAFKKVMSPYSKLCTVQADATNDQLESPISQVSTDYDFVIQELVGNGRCNREFFVVGGTAYFREVPKTGSSMMILELGRELISMQMDYSYLDLDVEVIGYNAFEQQTYIGKAKARSGLSQASLISPVPVFSLTDPDADNQDKATRRAEHIAQANMYQSKTGNMVVIGLPELVPGRFIQVAKVESMVNRKYYIKEVRHIMDESSYVTEIEIGGFI